jgi:hypothetical protein
VEKERKDSEEKAKTCGLKEVVDNTIRIARLKLLFIAAQITSGSNRTEVKYSHHDRRVSGFFSFMKDRDRRRNEPRPWIENPKWISRHLTDLSLNLSTG